MQIPLQITPLSACGEARQQASLHEAEQIFFETAILKEFESIEERNRFQKRWFGRYAEVFPSAFYLARGADSRVIGYLAGCLNSFEARSRALLQDIDYYTPAFIEALSQYPSHFHINVRPDAQGLGIGKALVGRFIAACGEAGSSGIHVVTGIGSPAVAFYLKCGFQLQPPLAHGSKTLAVLTLRI